MFTCSKTCVYFCMTESIVVLHYEKLEWTTARSSGGDKNTGLGGTPALVGFDAGDNLTYYKVNESGTTNVINLTKKKFYENVFFLSPVVQPGKCVLLTYLECRDISDLKTIVLHWPRFAH